MGGREVGRGVEVVWEDLQVSEQLLPGDAAIGLIYVP